jgi:hypothetical protein
VREHGRVAGARHPRAAPSRAVRRRRGDGAAPGPSRPLRRADLRHPEGGPRPPCRGRPRALLGARRADRAAGGRARGLGPGEDLQPRAAGQDPPA